MNQLHKCNECGYQMIDEEVWIPDNTKDDRVFCYSHAPDDAIRLKDTTQPIRE